MVVMMMVMMMMKAATRGREWMDVRLRWVLQRWWRRYTLHGSCSSPAGIHPTNSAAADNMPVWGVLRVRALATPLCHAYENRAANIEPMPLGRKEI